MLLIVGLGNPGKKYEKTRHNVGFDVIDELAMTNSIPMTQRKAKAFIGSGTIAGEKVLLAKPQTYMNLSGDSVARLASYYKIDPAKELIVVYDDIALTPGNLRVRRSGSAGGHNGMKDIIQKCGTDAFARVRVGVGDKEAGGDLVNHVLGHFSKGERSLVEAAISDAVGAIELLVAGKPEEAMTRDNATKG